MSNLSLKHRHVAGYFIILVLVSSNIFRAHTQSITHDEALTYKHFVSLGWEAILLSWSPNNHTLHSLLVQLSTSIFGLSHLSIRIPALVGGLLYLLAVERLCRTFFERRVGYFLSLAALTTSPFILDYLVVARGYSLALGFFMWAVLLCGLELYRVNPVEHRAKHFQTYFLISCLCAFSVASHLSFAFVNTSLLAVFFTWSCLFRNPLHGNYFSLKRVSFELMSLSVPGAVLFLSLNPAILQFDNTELYYGNQNWSQVYTSIVLAVFDDFAKQNLWAFRSEFVMWVVYRLPLFLALCILFGGLNALWSILQSYTGKFTINGNQKLWLFVFSIISIAIALHSFAYMIFGVLLPMERYGIFFVPLSILLSAISIEKFRDSLLQLIISYFGRMCLLIAVIYFVSSFHINYFRNWKYDSGSKEVFLILRSLNGDYSKGIGILWWYEPSLNFYRSYYNDSSIPPFTRGKPNSKQAYFVLLPDDEENKRFMKNDNIKVIFQHPVSRAVIGIKE